MLARMFRKREKVYKAMGSHMMINEVTINIKLNWMEMDGHTDEAM